MAAWKPPRPLHLVLGGLALAVVLAGAGWAWLMSSLPQTSGTLRAPGLEKRVTVRRDRFGVPRIVAESQRDAYFALGWVHAQDRLWQMELNRRAGAGRLAEVMGAAALETDRFTRTLGLYRLAEASLAYMKPEVLAAFEAYAAGVNSWIEHHEGALPPEFLILGYTPEPWRPADSAVWARLMGLQLSGNWREELLRTRLLQRLPADKMAQLWAPYGMRTPTTLGLLDDAQAATMLAAVPEIGHDHLASNAWALAGSRTDSGRPLLANDPHLGFQAPVLWYLAMVKAPGLEVTGATVPGVPFHLVGHNGRVAWGFTTTHSDTMDLFLEKEAPAGGYLTPQGAAPFESREEIIRVKDSDPITLTVRGTRHGPLVSDILGGRLPANTLVALSSATLQADDRTPQALYFLNRARDVGQVVEALRDFHAPQQNVTYADTEGGIGFSAPGLVPVRRAGDGLLPRPGWTGEWDWTGWVPYDALPHVINPRSGMLVNANNQVVPDDYPYLLAAHWPEPYRAARILDRLSVRQRHDRLDMAALQYDSLSPVALQFKPFLAGLPVKDEMARAALRLLEPWNGVEDRSGPESLIFEAWMLRFQQALIEDDLGELAASFQVPRPQFLGLVLREAQDWCDDSRTPARETCEQIAASALEAAVTELVVEHGGDMARWRWGTVHQAVFDHPLLRHIPGLARLGRLSIATDGGDFTVNRGTFTGVPPTPFTHSHGAGLRAVFDLADLGVSRFVVATGQSGNPLSKHYDDLLEAWRDGAYLMITPDANADTLILEPAR